jgi:DNA polymerase-4/DNA polymerase V
MSNNHFPKAILHLDGDAFFVSCELARYPGLRGKPVITGAERGIASAMSYEAKKIGVTRGMPVFQIKKNFPEVIILPSDYRTYQMYAERMYEIVRRFTGTVEEYSIDECFADITGLDQKLGKSFESILHDIQDTLFNELGISFSIGLSVTKVLAKIASKHNKPKGLTLIPSEKISDYIKDLPIGKVWGIGGQTSAYLLRRGIKTAGNFVEKSEDWVKENCSKPYYEIWLELRGCSAYSVNANKGRIPKSISSTGTFHPPSSSEVFIFSELSKHIEHVMYRARSLSLAPSDVSFFLKTKDYNYFKDSITLPLKSSLPHVTLSLIKESFEKLFKKNLVYRATGITLHGLIKNSHVSRDLFGESDRLASADEVFNVVDNLSEKFGSNTVFIGSSLSQKMPGKMAGYRKNKVHSKARKFFNIPFLGRTR